MDSDTLLLAAIAFICFLFYKLTEQNNRLERFRTRVNKQLRATASEARTVSSTPTVDRDENDSDDEVDEILEMVERAAGNYAGPVRQWRSNARRRNINFYQHIVGASNNDNLNLSLGLNLAPNLGPGGGAGEGLGFMGRLLASGAGNFLMPPRPRYALPE